jgi:hypothetical protein
MNVSRRAFSLAACAFALVLPAAALRAGSMDPALAGTWQYDAQNQFGKWLATWVIQPDGRYVAKYDGLPPLPVETGSVTARDGSYQLVADSGRRDFGSYSVKGRDEIIVVNAGGTHDFRRVAAAPAPAPAAAPAKAPAPVESDGSPSAAGFSGYRKAADAMAASVSPEFKLFRVDCFGAKAGKSIECASPIFQYCARNIHALTHLDGDWVILRIASGPRGASKVGWVGAYPAFSPRVPAPAAISEQDAFARLSAEPLNLPDRYMYLQLLCAGTELANLTLPNTLEQVVGDEGFVNLDMNDYPVRDRADLAGRWVWRIIAADNPGPITDQHRHVSSFVRHLAFRYLDASTGAPL